FYCVPWQLESRARAAGWLQGGFPADEEWQAQWRLRSVRRWLCWGDEGQQPAQRTLPSRGSGGRAGWLAVCVRLAKGPCLAHFLRQVMMPGVGRIRAILWGLSLTTAALANAQAPTPDSRRPGQRLYGAHCLSCHQADGGGVPNMQPPIAGGTWVKGDAQALALFVMTGGFGSSERKESANENVMPEFRQLPDA